MPVSVTLNATATVTLFVQFLIFVYLYYSSADRPRFFRYLIWACGLIVVLKTSHLSRQLFPEAPRAIGLLDAAGSARSLLILAAGMAYRWDYRLRWHHATLALPPLPGASSQRMAGTSTWSRSAGRGAASQSAYPCRSGAGGATPGRRKCWESVVPPCGAS